MVGCGDECGGRKLAGDGGCGGVRVRVRAIARVFDVATAAAAARQLRRGGMEVAAAMAVAHDEGAGRLQREKVSFGQGKG